MKRDPIFSAVIGMIAFALAHFLITSEGMRARLTPDPSIRPWFTNSTGSVLVTAAIVAAAAFAFAAAAGDRRAAMSRGVTVSAGAIVAMAAVLLKIGSGDLGPIVFIAGGAVLLAAGLAGGALAAAMKRQM